MKTIHDLNVRGKRVLLRADFNVPMDSEKNITDDIRIRMVLPTIRLLLEKGAKLIICSHCGRPKGERNPEFSLAPVAAQLERLVGLKVLLAPDCIGAEIATFIDAAGDNIVLLENLRFHKGETENDLAFSKALAAVAEVYINDAFAVSHRCHASVVGVAGLVREKAAGLLLQMEIDYFKRSMDTPVRPLAAVVGGVKVSSKLGALTNMLDKVDKMIIGGAMANTFLKSLGVSVGASKVEDELLETARGFIEDAEQRGVKIYFPVDFVVANRFAADAVVMNVSFRDIPDGWMALDIGPASSILFREALADVRTIIWNGPMGAFEMDRFAHGTMAMCHDIAASHALSIVGGGDSNAAVKKSGEESNISYLSTGGGAFLYLMEGKELPGVAALQ